MGFELFLFEVINPIASATWSQGQASISLNFNGCELLDLAKDSSPPPRSYLGGPHTNYRLADTYLPLRWAHPYSGQYMHPILRFRMGLRALGC